MNFCLMKTVFFPLTDTQDQTGVLMVYWFMIMCCHGNYRQIKIRPSLNTQTSRHKLDVICSNRTFSCLYVGPSAERHELVSSPVSLVSSLVSLGALLLI